METRWQRYFATGKEEKITKIIRRFYQTLNDFLPPELREEAFDNRVYENENTPVSGRRMDLLNNDVPDVLNLKNRKAGKVTYYKTHPKRGITRVDFTFTYKPHLESNAIAAIHHFAHECDLTLKSFSPKESKKQPKRSPKFLSRSPTRFWYDATRRNISILEIQNAENDFLGFYGPLVRNCEEDSSRRAPVNIRRFDLFVNSQRQGQLTFLRSFKEEDNYDSMISLMYKEGLGVENIKQFTRFMIHHGYEAQKVDPSYDE